MIKLNHTNLYLFKEWEERAFLSPIARFLTSNMYLDPTEFTNLTSEWNGSAFLSPLHATMLKVNMDRRYGTISVNLHSLAENPRRRVECGLALRTLMFEVLLPLRPRRVSCGVHSTNEESLKLMNKIFGPPWGIEPEGFWDRAVGKFVDAHYFSIETSKLIAKFNT